MEFRLGPDAGDTPVLRDGVRRDCVVQAVQAQLEILQWVVPMDAWLLTRTIDDDWIVLASADRHYGIHRGQFFKWGSSFCSEMVKGNAPAEAPRAQDIPIYRAQTTKLGLEIGAYLGYPIRQVNGELFGTLCAIHPSEQAPLTETQHAVVERAGHTLSALIQISVQIDRIERAQERAEQQARTDALTGLLNRRGFRNIIEGEHVRSAHLGAAYSAVVIDLDELKPINDREGHAAGDRLLQKAAQTLRSVTRTQDALARSGGDEFVVLFPETDGERCRQIERRIREAFEEQGIRASLGGATLRAGESIDELLARADRRMYEEKNSRKALPSATSGDQGE
ncbi:MAG: diguanylate cyclase domain-containing protein [Thioalkalivibrionaceae bacterium]